MDTKDHRPHRKPPLDPLSIPSLASDHIRRAEIPSPTSPTAGIELRELIPSAGDLFESSTTTSSSKTTTTSISDPVERSITPPKIPPLMAWADAFALSLQLWWRLAAKGLAMALSGLIVLCGLLLPARLLSRSALEEIYWIYFEIIIGVVQVTLLFLIFVVAVCNFIGRRMGAVSIYAILVPIWIISVVVTAPIGLNRSETSLVASVFSAFYPMSSWALKYTRSPPKDDLEALHLHGITQDGTPWALTKCLYVSFFLAYALMFGLSSYLEMDITAQLAVRLAVVPVVTALHNLYQYIFLHGLSHEFMPRRQTISLMINTFVIYISRMMINNVQDESSYMWFILMNLFAMGIEIVSRITFIHRGILFLWTSAFVRHHFSRFKQYMSSTWGLQFASNSNTSERQSSYLESDRLSPKPPSLLKMMSTNTISEHAKRIRAGYVLEEVSTEISVSILVPSLLYLVEPLFRHSNFKTISSIESCVYQIIIQVLFEIFGDIVSMMIEIRYLAIPLRIESFRCWDAFSLRLLILCYSSLYLYFRIAYSVDMELPPE